MKKGKNKWTLGIGENLANIDSLFEGDLSYSGAKTLSNDLEISKGMIYCLAHLQLTTRN